MIQMIWQKLSWEEVFLKCPLDQCFLLEANTPALPAGVGGTGRSADTVLGICNMNIVLDAWIFAAIYMATFSFAAEKFVTKTL